MARRVTSTRPAPVAAGPLRCRVVRGPDAEGRWYWRIDPCGTGARAIERGWFTPEEVFKRAAEIVASGVLDAPATLTSNQPVTVEEMLLLYADDYRKRRHIDQSTKDNVRRSINHLRRHVGSVALDEVSKQTIKRYCREREDEIAAASTIVKEWLILATAWNESRESGWVNGSLPSHDITKIIPVYNHRTPTEDEVSKVLHHLRYVQGFRKDGQPRRNRADWPWIGLLIALHTGARVGTIEGLRWGDVELFNDQRTATLYGKRSRSNPTGRRAIQMTTRLRDELRDLWMATGQPPSDDFIVGVKQGMLRGRGNDKLRQACEAVGVPRFTWHGIRRLVVRRMRRSGDPVTEAAAYLGHSKIVMLSIYDELDESDTTSAADQMEKLIGG